MSGDVSALQLVLSGDPGLFAIVWLSLLISLSAVLLAAVIGVPLGAFLALTRFPGREGVIVVLNALRLIRSDSQTMANRPGSPDSTNCNADTSPDIEIPEIHAWW